MNLVRTQRKANVVMTVVAIALFCVFSFFMFPVDFASKDIGSVHVSTASTMEEYEEFNASLMKIFEDYESGNAEKVSASSLGTQFDSNRLIVTADANIDDYGAVAKAEFNDHHIFQYQDAKSAQSAYNYFSQLSYVEDVVYDCKITANDITEQATTSYENPWGQKYVGYAEYKTSMLELAGEQSLNKVVVAVLDTGINTSHVLFKDRLLLEYARNYTNTNSAAYEDQSGHGSHVSGIIASATYNNVMILPLRVLDSEGDGWSSWIIDAVDYLISIKPMLESQGYIVNMMNMSLGVKTTKSDVSAQRSTSLTNAVINAYNAGILAIVSAGNEATDTSYAIPANVDCAITVSALKNVGTKESPSVEFDASYSNYGKHIDFSAPGTGIESAWKGGSTAASISRGTSMAAPHVTAAVALIYSNPYYADYSIDEVVALLKENCQDLGPSGWDNKYGHGAISIGNIGVLYEGYVEFSVTEKMHDSEFKLQLAYDDKYLGQNEVSNIYYSIDPYASLINESATAYSGEIAISKTTKVTAIAYVRKRDTGILVKKSYISAKTYYFDNIDLESNFDTAQYGSYCHITKYRGELSTLNVQSLIGGRGVRGIASQAFNSSNVTVLNLPNTIRLIDASAFSGNSRLQEIHCLSVFEIEIGANAFKNCSNLRVVDFAFEPSYWVSEESSIVSIGEQAFRYCYALEEIDVVNVKNVGAYAFANCTKLKELFMPMVLRVYQHAFSVSGVEKLFIGKNITILENQVNLQLKKIYGYAGTLAETLAYNHNAEFVDLTLRIEENLPTKKIIKQSEVTELSLVYTAFVPDFKVLFSGTTSMGSYKVNNINEYTSEIVITLQSGHNTGKFELYVLFYGDFYSTNTLLKSNTINLEIVSDDAETFVVDFEENNFLVYVDNEIITKSSILYKDVSYDFKIVPINGYDLTSVKIGGVEYNADETITITNNADSLKIEAVIEEKQQLNVLFNSDSMFDVLVGEQVVDGAQTVARGNDLMFKIEPEKGYEISRVTADGKLLFADDNGVYTISDVTTDMEVEVLYKKLYYSLNVSIGKGGSVSTTGNVVLNGLVEYGTTGSYNFNSYHGYRLDFVSVNGEIVNLKNMELDLGVVDQDYVIIASFVEENGLAGDNPMIMTYLLIFIGLFVVFIIGKILVVVFRKEKNKKKI